MSVSPAAGIRDVRVIKSMLREPMTATVGIAILCGLGIAW